MSTENSKSDNQDAVPVTGHDTVTIELRLLPAAKGIGAGPDAALYYREPRCGSLKFIMLSQARMWLTLCRVVDADDTDR